MGVLVHLNLETSIGSVHIKSIALFRPYASKHSFRYTSDFFDLRAGLQRKTWFQIGVYTNSQNNMCPM